MGTLSIYFVLSLAYELTKIYAEEEELNLSPLNGALLALFAFIMTVPQIVFEGGAYECFNKFERRFSHC